MLPIVLIHGFPFDNTMWKGQVDFLRSDAAGGAHRTVITPDLPGFGHSPIPAPAKERASIEMYAQHIHDVISKECGGKAIVAGFSMGGYALLALLRDFPEDVAAAMFIDTRPDPDSADVRANRMKSIEEIQADGATKVLDALAARIIGKQASDAARRRVREVMERQSPAAMVAALSAMAKRRDQSDLLPELKIPVLIVVGAEDSVTPPSVALAMQSHMPQAMVVQIVSAGHMAPMEQTEAVNRALQAFLATVKD